MIAHEMTDASSSSAGIQARYAGHGLNELLCAAHDCLPEDDCRTCQALEFGGDENFIMQQRRA
jgi:hypothetical protein